MEETIFVSKRNIYFKIKQFCFKIRPKLKLYKIKYNAMLRNIVQIVLISIRFKINFLLKTYIYLQNLIFGTIFALYISE